MQCEMRFQSVSWHKGGRTLRAVRQIPLSSCLSKRKIKSGVIHFHCSLQRSYCFQCDSWFCFGWLAWLLFTPSQKNTSWAEIKVSFSVVSVVNLESESLHLLSSVCLFFQYLRGNESGQDSIIKLIEKCIVGVSWVWLAANTVRQNHYMETCKLYCYITLIITLFSLQCLNCFLFVLQDSANDQHLLFNFTNLVKGGLWSRLFFLSVCDPGQCSIHN